MRRGSKSRQLAAMLLAVVVLSGCYGPFNLTRKVHDWNGQAGGKWTNEVVFLAFYILPVYSIAMLGDGLIFNSLEFWTGDNPIDPPYAAMSATQTKQFARGDQTVVLERADVVDGRQMSIEVFQGEALVSKHQIEATVDGPTVMKDAEGQILGSAETTADGSMVLRDAEGMVQKTYSSREMDRLAKKFSATTSVQ